MRKNVLILGHNDATQFIDIYNQYTRVFDQDQYEVTVAYLTGQADASVKERLIAENVLFLNIPKKSLRTLKINPIRKLLALCKAKKFEIVICHRYKPTYIMMCVAKLCKIPALIGVMHELKTMSSFNRRLTMASLSRRNMLLAGVSNAVREDMRKDLWGPPKDRLATLYNMIDVEMTEPQMLTREAARDALKIPADAFVFGNIARLAPNKDQHTLIQSFALIKPYCPRVKLMLIGDGALEAELRAQVRAHHLENDVIFTGFLPNASHYIKAFDCFVLSSIQEAFGRVLLEAMVAKLPIIATRVYGIPEVVDQCGWLIKPRDALGLCSAMKKVYMLSNEERAQYGEQAYQRAIDHFSIPQFKKQFWQLPLLQTLGDRT